MRNKAAVIAAAMLAIGLIGGSAEAVEVRGYRSCGKWIKDRAERGWEAVANRAWLVGYLSGMAMGSGIDAIKGTDNESLEQWIENYCKASPLKDISDGGMELFLELKRQKGL